MRVLVVEDDEGIAAGLRGHLRQHGCAVDTAEGVGTAWAALRAEPFDVVLLDLGLPDGDGAEVLRRVRQAPADGLPDPHTPVLIMTARDEVSSRIAGLDLGADDYVTKPFDPDELAARMRALRRRAQGRSQPSIRCGDLEIDPAARTVLRAGVPVELAAREFAVLLALVEARPRVLSPAADRGPAVQLERGAREQRHRGARAPPAPQARRRRDPHDARRRLLRPGRERHGVKATSLLRNLLAWTLAALAVVWASFIVVGFRTGIHEADELTDGHLASVASLLLSERDGSFSSQRNPAAVVSPDLKQHDYQQSLSVVIWDGSGRVLTHTGEAPQPVFDDKEGFADLRMGEPAATWRTFSQWDGPQQKRKVMVLLSVEERDGLAWDIGEQMAEPGLWLLPVITIALGLAIQRGLTPLHELSRDVHDLDASQAEPLRARHPQTEFKAVVDAINLLVERQQAAIERERQLASELAHELRTPLASLALHARAMRGPQTDAERADSLERLERDSLRAGHVLAQLLSLARASRTELAEAAKPLDLAKLAGEVVADYAQPALDSGHELALAAPPTFELKGHPVLLEMALRNLIDNALGHTAAGTLVEVQVDAQGRWLQVCDNGGAAGGPARTDVGPSRLTLGLGLGHRVVEKIAAIHGAEFAKVPAPDGFSACYRVSFPAG